MSTKHYPTINVVNAAKAWYRSVEKQRIAAGSDGKLALLAPEDKKLYLVVRALLRAEERAKKKPKPTKARFDYN